MLLVARLARGLARRMLPNEVKVLLSRLDQLDWLSELEHLAALEQLSELQRLSHLERLDELGELHHLQQLDSLRHLRKLDQIEGDLTAIRNAVANHDSRLDVLGAKLADPNLALRRPVYGVAVPAGPANAHWLNRCRAVEHYLEPVGDLRLIDIGSSGGFVSCYLAARGATVEGWEADPVHAELARAAGAVSGIDVAFRNRPLDGETVNLVEAGSVDAVLLLGTGPAAAVLRSGEAGGHLLAALLDRVPLVIVETVDGEDERDFLDGVAEAQDLTAAVAGEAVGANGGDEAQVIERYQLGQFPVGESTSATVATTTLWALRLRRNSVTVNGTSYTYRERRSEAYDDSPMPMHGAGRRYYFDDLHIVKEYQLDGSHTGVNRSQILTEINVLSQLSGMASVPELVDFELVPSRARIVIRRVPGHLLADMLDAPLAPKAVGRIVADVLDALAQLEHQGLSHNDVRSWNVIFDGNQATLIDYGLVSNVASEVDVRSLLWVVKAVLTGEREDFDSRQTGLPERRIFAVDPELEKLYQVIAHGLTSPHAVSTAIGSV